MKLTEQSIGKEYKLLAPMCLKKKRRVLGVIRLTEKQGEVFSGEMREYVAGKLSDALEPCGECFNADGMEVDLEGVRVINGSVLEEI